MKHLKQIIILTLLSAILSCNMNIVESSSRIQINCLSKSRAIINKTITSIELTVTGKDMKERSYFSTDSKLQIEVPHGEDRVFSIEILYSDYTIYQGTSEKVDVAKDTNIVDIYIDRIPFQTKWKVGTDKTLKFPLKQFGSYDFIIDWGDGTKSTVTSYSDLVLHPEYTLGMSETYGTLNHTYQKEGEYIVIVTGFCDGFGYTSEYTGQKSSTNSYLLDVLSWGRVLFNNTDINMSTFAFCDGLGDLSARDIPDLSNTTSLQNMFLGSSIKSGLKNWDTSGITDMSFMFNNANRYNEDISSWDTSNTTIMMGMFSETEFFNGNISTWNVSKVENMSYLFNNAINFNRDLSKWNTSSATDMSYMFQSAVKFNQDISSWNVFKVYMMRNMFFNATSFTCGGIDQSIWIWDINDPNVNLQDMFKGSPFEFQEPDWLTNMNQA